MKRESKNRERARIIILVATVGILTMLFLFRRPPAPLSSRGKLIALETNGLKSVDHSASNLTSGEYQEPTTIERGTPSSPMTIPSQDSDRTETKMLWRTPIIFFGRVIDESNQPVAGVLVSYGANTANEQLTEEMHNEGSTTSDERGVFKISGVRGRSFVMELSHPAYYVSRSNPPGFDYAGELVSGRAVPDTEDKAMVFYMHHKGNPTALIERRGGLHKPADGTTLDFPLRGKARTEVIGQLQVQGWKGLPDPRSGHFDWKVRITVPDGGVLESTNEFAFVAPESGYRQTLEINVSKDDLNWRVATNSTLFFKLPNYFVRGEVSVDLFHDLYFSMHYLVNPNGSANLENDPTKSFQEP
jgi:protocatechuate 3,4-dioxygenase beta subunit